MDLEPYYTEKRRRRVRLIFNPSSGSADRSPRQMMQIIGEMQRWKLIPEVTLLNPDSDLSQTVRGAFARGVRLFAACGGDGTISAAAKALFGLPGVTLGILPAGTQNNIARSLGIPSSLPDAVALLRTGRRTRIDMGKILCRGRESPFLEVCSVGLMSALFPAGDEIQHGRVDKVGDFLATLMTSSPSHIRLRTDAGEEISASGHAVILSNMPYVFRHFPVGDSAAFRDGLLDILFVADIPKGQLVRQALRGPGGTDSEDPRIRHLQARSISVEANPIMAVMADGTELEDGPITVSVARRALAVLLPPAGSSGESKKDETIPK